jgi:uncharacterized protein YmfQ (DUF2313 family)
MVRIGYLSIDIIMMVALYQSNTLIWIFIVLANETTVYRYMLALSVVDRGFNPWSDPIKH